MPSVRDLAMYFGFMTLTMSAASLPIAPATLLAVKVSPPWQVALVGSVAAFIAAHFDYWFVRRAFRIGALDRLRQRKLFIRAERWAQVAPFITVIAFAALPLPYAIARVLVPLSGYARLRYATAYAVGRFPRVYVIAAFGTVVEIPTRVLIGLLVGGVALAGIGALIRRRREARREASEQPNAQSERPTSP